VSVRGGGHNVAGNALCDDGLMIDLSLMKGIEIDPDLHMVVAQPGCTLGDMDRASDRHGLAVPAGIISETGIAGLTLGGGVGWLVRKFGLTCDNLISADVVTAAGDAVKASAEENEDLFWGLRGGGGNFGVVTSFQYRAHEVSRVLGCMFVHPRAAARDVFRFYRDFTKPAPEELTAYCAMLTLPDGTAAVAVIACYCGDPATGEKVLAPLREFGSPLDDSISHIPRLEMQTLFDPAFPYGNQNYWKSSFIDELTDDAIDTLVEHANRMASPLSAVMCEYYFGGPASRVGETETAFAHRNAQYDIGIIGQWTNPEENEQHMNWAREAYAAIEPYANGRIYANLMGGDQMTDESEVRAAFGENYERLVALKRKYDPTNFFRLNQNINPDG
jgi:FAD/FMN-containing dehydrogenase